MNYLIKSVTSKQEMKNALTFGTRIFGGELDFGYAGYSDEMIDKFGDLLIYAESDSEIVGIVFGRVEDNGNMTVGPVAVDGRFRKHGVACEMMNLIEERAKVRGVHLIALGAVETAEGFYSKLGYTGSLLIQSEQHSIEELLSLNTKYEVKYTRVYNSKINQVCLALSEADRELQHKYETELPGTRTQMMFWKNI